MELTQISKVKGRLIKNLSKGYKQRVGMAQAIIGRPPLIILDEPTIGLDPTQTVEIRTLLNELKKSHTILFSSHILSEVNEVCDRVLMINEGKLIADSTSEELAGRVTKGRKKCHITATGANELVLSNDQTDRRRLCRPPRWGSTAMRSNTGKRSGISWFRRWSRRAVPYSRYQR